MDQVILFIRNQLKRSQTIPLLGAGVIILIVALILGVSENLSFLIVAVIGIGLIIFAFVHHWREAHLYGTLFAGAVISFPVLILLHNIFDGINKQIGTVLLVNQLLDGLAVISFLGAIFLAPVAAVIGIIGGLFYLAKSKM